VDHSQHFRVKQIRFTARLLAASKNFRGGNRLIRTLGTGTHGTNLNALLGYLRVSMTCRKPLRQQNLLGRGHLCTLIGTLHLSLSDPRGQRLCGSLSYAGPIAGWSRFRSCGNVGNSVLLYNGTEPSPRLVWQIYGSSMWTEKGGALLRTWRKTASVYAKLGDASEWISCWFPRLAPFFSILRLSHVRGASGKAGAILITLALIDGPTQATFRMATTTGPAASLQPGE